MDSINASSLPFDPFAAPFGASESSYDADFSPISLFSPLEDFADPDLASDSAGSQSPVSPGLSASSYGFPTTDEWTHWDSIEQSPEPDVLFKSEPFASPLLSAMPSKGAETPAVNPMNLTMPVAYPFTFEAQAQALHNHQAPILHQQPYVNLAQVPAHTVVPSRTPSTEQDDAPARRYPKRSLKRKSDDEDDLEDDDEPLPKRRSLSPSSRGSADKEAVPKKSAHNMIEKRYRNNINKKIEELRDAVPELRTIQQRLQGMNADVDENGALPPVAKLNKATILSKATEYIKELERKLNTVASENNTIRGRMQNMEQMIFTHQAAQAQADQVQAQRQRRMLQAQAQAQAQAQMMSQRQSMSPVFSPPPETRWH